MDDMDDSDTSDWPTFTPRETVLLAEAVASGATGALGMLCAVKFHPETRTFHVRLAAQVAPEHLH